MWNSSEDTGQSDTISAARRLIDPSIQASIDQASDDADARLTELVSQYDMQKPFSIRREEQSGGNIMGF